MMQSDPAAILRAAVWMAGSIIAFSLMAVAGRAVSFELDTFEIMLYRSVVGVIIMLVAGSLTGTLYQVRPRRIGLHLIRNVCHFTGQNLWFLAITMIPLAQVFALEFTGPLWALLLASLILGERLTRMRALAAFAGFIGILIVTRPGAGALDIGVLAAAAAAVGFAFTAVFTRLLTRTETLTSILIYMTVLQTLFGLVCAGFDGDIALPSAASLPWLAVIGFCGLAAHLCLTKALSLAPAAVVLPIDFARLPLIAVVGLLFYAEPVDAYVLIGALIIFGANYANIYHETRARRAVAR
ncbi:DMT family transporter [Roseovarius spongiae]|uniref:DMT family transporter n=1 Tax=Roseovarius spongiae TaxID=2320272 RepID=A0A3A8AUE4_9RHOB|nr:DMT family transporter [Roseovarius spongiae]RKF15279.1 DMT family transporter [Roseovarius spongiae]